MPRQERWFCMRGSGVANKYVGLVQNMYKSSMTGVKSDLRLLMSPDPLHFCYGDGGTDEAGISMDDDVCR